MGKQNKGDEKMKEKCVVMTLTDSQWHGILEGRADIVVQRSGPEKLEMPARVIVHCKESGQLVGYFLCGKIQYRGHVGGLAARALQPLQELMKLGGDGVMVWSAGDAVAFQEPHDPEEIGIKRAPARWKQVEIEEDWPWNA